MRLEKKGRMAFVAALPGSRAQGPGRRGDEGTGRGKGRTREKGTNKGDGLCQQEECLIQLNFINGRHVCPKCRRGFCHFHWEPGKYQIKMGVDGLHDTVYGILKPVCATCFFDREW